jgi:hypothetical protein
MKKYFAPTLLVVSITFAAGSDHAQAWEWNPSKFLTPPTWITKPVASTTRTVTTSTKSAWRSFTKGTSAAWKKTTEILDPYPNEVAEKKISTPNEFFAQKRPEE